MLTRAHLKISLDPEQRTHRRTVHFLDFSNMEISATFDPAATKNDKRVPKWRDAAQPFKQVVAVIEGKPVKVVQTEIKYPRDGAGRLGVCVWIFGKNTIAHGVGTAGGYGYHKASAALDVALKEAGAHLSSAIGGLGDQACDDALVAVARAAIGKNLPREAFLIV